MTISDPPWIETYAEVIACKYKSGAEQALAFGIVGSIILSLIWLALMRGCN